MTLKNNFPATALLFLLLLGAAGVSASAQVYPVRTDLEKAGMKGEVRQVIEHARSWSAPLDRWNPLVITTSRSFTKEGQLRREVILYRNEPVDEKMYRYDSATGTARPIAEASAASDGTSGAGRLVRESVYAYGEENELQVIRISDYEKKVTHLILHQYDTKGRLKRRITSDSADRTIRRIEDFYWLADDRPAGSVIRTFDPKTDPFQRLKDSTKVPESRIDRDYTSYSYDNAETPVIYWHWEFNGDSVVDRQTVMRFDHDDLRQSLIIQKFRDTTVIESRAQIFNAQGDVISTADLLEDGRTLERAFDYIYDQLDDAGNWVMRRQYVAKEPGNLESTERILLSRTDRTILYY